MAQVRLADLPTTDKVTPESFVIIERPGFGDGTYKSTVSDLQKAITVVANVTHDGDSLHIYIKDINGVTEESIVAPTVTITREGKISTIKIHDWRGTTIDKIVNPTSVITREGQIITITLTDEDGLTSQSFVVPAARIERDGQVVKIVMTDETGLTTQNLVVPTASVTRDGQTMSFNMTDEEGPTSESFLVPYVSVDRSDQTITIAVKDDTGESSQSIIVPTAKITDNGDNTATISLTDENGETHETIVSRVIIDPEPTEGSPNLITSGTAYDLVTSASSKLNVIASELEVAHTRILELESRLAQAEAFEARALVIEDGTQLEDPFLSEGVRYDSLKDAILGTSTKGGTVTLVSNGESSGIAVPEAGSFTLDLNGYTLNMVGPGAGSPGTETNGMQLLKDSTITIKNGRLDFKDDRLKIGIQNYSNLTLDNVIITGGTTVLYVVSNNYGNVVFKNGTKIVASPGRVAFDAYYGLSAAYDSGVNVTIEDESVVIDGKVEFGKSSRASIEGFAANASITCPEAMELSVTVLNPPCVWTTKGDGYKVLKYSGE